MQFDVSNENAIRHIQSHARLPHHPSNRKFSLFVVDVSLSFIIHHYNHFVVVARILRKKYQLFMVDLFVHVLMLFR